MSRVNDSRREGLVVFADILGYSQIKVGGREVADAVFESMNHVLEEKSLLEYSLDIREYIPDEMANAICIPVDEERRICESQLIIEDRITMSMISDSFVCVADLTDADEATKRLLVSSLIKVVAAMNSSLLAKGLPLRGGISFGEYYANTSCGGHPTAFLGDAIMRAHAIEGDVEAACICADDKAKEICDKYYDISAASVFDRSSEEPELRIAKVYSKKFGEVDRLCVNPPREQKQMWWDQLDGIIETMFSQYGRDITKGTVPAKIKNTVRFIRSVPPLAT